MFSITAILGWNASTVSSWKLETSSTLQAPGWFSGMSTSSITGSADVAADQRGESAGLQDLARRAWSSWSCRSSR